MSELSVFEIMTPAPHTINADVPVIKAMHLMRDLSVRHLPVLRAGNLVGMITDRDLKLAASLGKGTDWIVEDLMTSDPIAVTRDVPVLKIIETMIEKKVGSIVVTDAAHHVHGIVTTIDALCFLKELMIRDREMR